MVEHRLEVVQVTVDLHIAVSMLRHRAREGADDGVVLCGRRRRRMRPVVPCPGFPVLEVIEHRVGHVGQVVPLHLLRDEVRLYRPPFAVVRIAEQIDAIGDLEAPYLAEVPFEALVKIVAVAKPQDNAIHTRLLDLVPIDVLLPFGYVDDVRRRGGENLAVAVEECLDAVSRRPLRTGLRTRARTWPRWVPVRAIGAAVLSVPHMTWVLEDAGCIRHVVCIHGRCRVRGLCGIACVLLDGLLLGLMDGLLLELLGGLLLGHVPIGGLGTRLLLRGLRRAGNDGGGIR